MNLKHLAALIALVAASTFAGAQNIRTAQRTYGVSVFAGGSGIYTGIGRNGSITAGVDLTYHPDSPLNYALEIRGTEPVKSGGVAGEKNFLLGPRVNYVRGRLNPYVDFLIGRGEIDYFGKGRPVPGTLFYYTKTHSTVYSPGFGLDYRLTDNFSLKGDFQYQRNSTPVSTTGHLYSKATTIAIVYSLPHGRRKGRSEY